MKDYGIFMSVVKLNICMFVKEVEVQKEYVICKALHQVFTFSANCSEIKNDLETNIVIMLCVGVYTPWCVRLIGILLLQ